MFKKSQGEDLGSIKGDKNIALQSAKEEAQAIKDYKERLKVVQDANLKAMIEETIKDEEDHFKNFNTWLSGERIPIDKISSDQDILGAGGDELPDAGIGDVTDKPNQHFLFGGDREPEKRVDAAGDCPYCDCRDCACSFGDLENCTCSHACYRFVK